MANINDTFRLTQSECNSKWRQDKSTFIIGSQSIKALIFICHLTQAACKHISKPDLTFYAKVRKALKNDKTKLFFLKTWSNRAMNGLFYLTIIEI